MSELTKEDAVLDMMMAFCLQSDSNKALRELCQKTVDQDNELASLKQENAELSKALDELCEERDKYHAEVEQLKARLKECWPPADDSEYAEKDDIIQKLAECVMDTRNFPHVTPTFTTSEDAIEWATNAVKGDNQQPT